MINYFKTSSLQEATRLYIDIIHSLGSNQSRVSEASRQFADLTHPSYQLLVLKLAKIDGLEFNCNGLIITVTKFSYNYRFQLGSIRVPGYLTRYNDETNQWNFIPTQKISLSQDIVMNLLKKVKGIEIRKSGSWIWISGNTFPVRNKLYEAVKGTFLSLKFKKSTKEWYLRPRS